MTDSRHPARGASFRDRSLRLVLFGVCYVSIGGLSTLFGLLYLVLAFSGGRLLGPGAGIADTRSYVMGAMLYFLLGAAFAGVGAGSIRRRRWARPLALTLAWSWLLGGALTLPLMPALLDGSLAAVPGLDVGLAGMLRIALLGVVAVFGVALPAVFVLVYRDPQLRTTCEVYDPNASWTERCPPSVLGLSVGLGAAGVFGLLFMVRPMMPLFGWLATGWPAAGSLLIGAAISFWMAREIYALRWSGWWVTTLLLTLLGVSTWVTLLRVEPNAWYRAAGYPDELIASLPATNTLAAWLTLALTLLTVIYMVVIRKHFHTNASALSEIDRDEPSIPD